MRHGRAKAARKTLAYFERAVRLKSRPYYSVLLDATFLIAMVRITTTTASITSTNTEDSSTIVSRIERVLQVNGSASHGGGSSRDERLGYVNDNNNNTNFNSGHSYSHNYNNYNVRFFIPQEAVDELEKIVQTFKDRSEATKKQKKKNQYQAKSKVFEDALDWIKQNSSRGGGNGRCEVLPRLDPLETKARTQQQQRKNHHKQKEAAAEEETTAENHDENNQALSDATITASDAVRRHIARDDGREDSSSNTTSNSTSTNFSRTFMVASQEEALLDGLRMLGTVPILRCANNASVLILEHASKKGQRTEHVKETTKWRSSLQNPAEKALVDAAWKAQKAKAKGSNHSNILGGNHSRSEPSTTRGFTKAKGPNPLSCKKRKHATSSKEGHESNSSKSKKRRQRAQRNKSNAINGEDKKNSQYSCLV
mmetsp:Transcript_2444/g.5165  ORF Transcript_2444/g.5165 Transcript_2444/m.5165 type:complete len:425 (-) Transcript_2444:348-1622(-)